MLWLLRLGHRGMMQSGWWALDAAATFGTDVLGVVPVVGPALAAFGFALQVTGRVKAASGNLHPAQSRLARIAKHTVEVLHSIVQQQAEDCFAEVSELLEVIKEGARQLESFENLSTVQITLHGVFKGMAGPIAVMELAKQREQRLGFCEVHRKDAKMGDLSKQPAERQQHSPVMASNFGQFGCCTAAVGPWCKH
ncbi:unnamed protein product [Ostreobium quekettii]|uniref:Uncharacterized protein n=1 Tax=Ostreobium quekettii TaxID=121088 RepID=A0A8S1IV40_9CHLO|nr:unnamed protein product [Ostreobium quekettii]